MNLAIYNLEEEDLTKDELESERWYRGNLTFLFHEAQVLIHKAFLQSKSSLFVGNCSRQWGKSYWAVIIAIAQALRFPHSQIRYGAAFKEDLVTYLIPKFEEILRGCPEEIRGEFRVSGTSYIFPNGSRIKLVGLDKNPNGLRGNTLDLIILDEVGFVSNLDYIYRSIIMPATLHRPNAKIVMISTPPVTPAHDFADYVQKAQLEGGYGEFDIDTNPLVTEEQKQKLIAELGGMNSTTTQRELYCRFVVESDLQLIPEWKDEFVQSIPKDDFYSYYHKYVAMDLGRKDKTALLFGYYEFKTACLIIEDELEMLGAEWTTETLVRDLKVKEEQVWGEHKPFRRISDNNNPHLIIDLSSIHGINFIETNKESLEAMINEVRLLVGAGRIIVNPRCKQLVGCLKYGVWDKNRKEFARSKSYGHFDMLAALVYLVRNLNQNSNPIPAVHGHEQHRSWMGHTDTRQLSNNAKTIGNLFKIK